MAYAPAYLAATLSDAQPTAAEFYRQNRSLRALMPAKLFGFADILCILCPCIRQMGVIFGKYPIAAGRVAYIADGFIVEKYPNNERGAPINRYDAAGGTLLDQCSRSL